MTLTEIIDCSADQLAAMTNEQLLAHFNQYLIVTRPELAVRASAKQGVNDLYSPEEKNQMELKIKKLQAMGIEINSRDILKRKK